MNNKLLTVIIPVYNIEKYIEKCLTSVVKQIHHGRNISVIVVIDGSTDSSLYIINRFADKNPEIDLRIFLQKNQGLSVARNKGLVSTNTDYVTFLDGDDYWCDDYLETVLPQLEKARPDILEYDAFAVTEFERRLRVIRTSSGAPYRTERVSRKLFLKEFLCYAWARVYKTRLFQERMFPEGRRFEDTSTIPWIYWNCSNILSLGIPLIAYRQRRGSILWSPTLEDIADINTATNEAIAMYQASLDLYWRDVAMRIFQQACSRTTNMPIKIWYEAMRITHDNAIIKLPQQAGWVRYIQINVTALYITLLFIKRKLIDPVLRLFSQLPRVESNQRSQK